MNELSIFIDESSDVGPESERYLVTLVFHNQAVDIYENIERYEQSIRNSGLAKSAFHFTPIIRGHDRYSLMEYRTRRKLFTAFAIFTEKIDFKYGTFAYMKREFPTQETLENKIRRDINLAIRNNLEFFQSFDTIKIYYDNGQKIVTRAIHGAIESTVSKEAIVYRDVSPASHYLSQVADYVCGIELTAIRHQTHTTGNTEERFFGEWANFKKNYLKKIRKKRIG